MRKTNVKVVTVTVFIATFMTAIEGTIVSTAMPTIVGSLHGLAIMNWVFSIYLLTNAMITPIYGKLADSIGRKPVFIIGTFLFILGSGLCGASQDMLQLILFRALQGIGAGAIMPVALTIIADIYPIEKRAKILGLNSSAWGIASVFGPLFGGFIVDALSWHWIFLVNVPIGIILIVLVAIFLVEPKKEKQEKKPVDIAGSLSLMGVLLLLLYGFQIIGSPDVSLLIKVMSFVGAIILFAGFVWIEKRAQDPVISLDLFKNHLFVTVNLVAALLSGFLIGVEVYIPMWMQGVLGMKAAMGGMALAPMSLTWIVGSFLTGRLIEKYQAKHILQLGLSFSFVGGLALALVPVSTPFWIFVLIASILGIGFGIVITTTTILSQGAVPHEQLGVATSFNTLVRTVGQTVMVSVFGVILNNLMNRAIAANPHEGVTSDMMNQLVNPHTAGELPQKLLPILRGFLYKGLHGVYFVGVALVVVAFLVNQFQKNQEKQME